MSDVSRVSSTSPSTRHLFADIIMIIICSLYNATAHPSSVGPLIYQVIWHWVLVWVSPGQCHPATRGIFWVAHLLIKYSKQIWWSCFAIEVLQSCYHVGHSSIANLMQNNNSPEIPSGFGCALTICTVMSCMSNHNLCYDTGDFWRGRIFSWQRSWHSSLIHSYSTQMSVCSSLEIGRLIYLAMLMAQLSDSFLFNSNSRLENW